MLPATCCLKSLVHRALELLHFVVYVRPAMPSLLAMVKFCTLDVAIAPTSWETCLIEDHSRVASFCGCGIVSVAMADADFDLSQDEVSALAGISMFFSALSLLGSGFIIACYLRFRELRMFTFKLVFMLSVNDFINQVGDFLQPSAAEVLTARTADNVDALCMVQVRLLRVAW